MLLLPLMDFASPDTRPPMPLPPNRSPVRPLEGENLRVTPADEFHFMKVWITLIMSSLMPRSCSAEITLFSLLPCFCS